MCRPSPIEIAGQFTTPAFKASPVKDAPNFTAATSHPRQIKLDLVEIISLDKAKEEKISEIGQNINWLKEKMYRKLSRTIKMNFELKL
jgi:hypothetical protein